MRYLSVTETAEKWNIPENVKMSKAVKICVEFYSSLCIIKIAERI